MKCSIPLAQFKMLAMYNQKMARESGTYQHVALAVPITNSKRKILKYEARGARKLP
jgi:hypothetical protein